MKSDDITFVRLNHREIDYPVGNYISTNLQIIKDMSYNILQLYGHKNICLWCRGSSGAIIAGIIANILEDIVPNIVINYVKKANEESHAHVMVPIFGYVNIIVDDFIRTGDTVIGIAKAIRVSDPDEKIHCLCVSGN
jgi:phosphoribosylpyrophosphate synthetase